MFKTLKFLYSAHLPSSRPIVDNRIIKVRAGKGGNGCLSYTKHAKHNLLGPGYPCGGRGGKGGNVFLQASNKITNLSNIKSFIFAQNGYNGQSSHVNGQPGKNEIINVPLGSVVWKLHSKSSTLLPTESEKDFLGDLDSITNSRLKVAEGGNGGRGNSNYAPYNFELGEEGEETYIQIELKSIADVGLVGFPNAGKSSLLSAISKARPKIAPYPFTTLAPYIGYVNLTNDYHISVADIPGIIEGAHQNIGLGLHFLSHVVRTSLLLFIIDVSPQSNISPYNAFKALRSEITHYGQNLAEKPFLVIANKCDFYPNESLKNVDIIWENLNKDYPGIPLFPISARYGDGIPRLLKYLKDYIKPQ